MILVLYKKGEREDIRNYRPLSMANAIYKLLTSVLNNRIIGPISEVIGIHQTGFLPDWQIFDSVKLVQCLIDGADQKGEELLRGKVWCFPDSRRFSKYTSSTTH